MKDEIKIRHKWPNNGEFDPTTKVETPKPQKKNRSLEKQNLKKVLRNINSLEDLDDYED